MRKYFIFIIIMVCAGTVAELSASETNLMPPPVSVINWHKGSGVLNIRGIYLGMEPKDDQFNAPSINGGGIVCDINKAFTDRLGMNFNFSFIGMTGKAEDDFSRQDLSFITFSYNPNLVVELIGGEKKNIAGEIIEDGFSWSVFGGFGVSMMTMDISQRSKSAGSAGSFYSVMKTTLYSLDFGTVMEFPLAFWISLVPNYYAVKYTSMKVDGKSVGGFKSPMQSIYGMDILIRPLKLNPNLKVSLGILMGLVDANTDTSSGYKSTLIMLGLQYEWGKHYSSLLFHPGAVR